MPKIVLQGFSGEQPRIIPRLMPEMAAQSAINTRLDDGGLTPMRKSALVDTGAVATWQTILLHLDEWLGWDTVVNAVPGPVAEDRLYFTGDGVPKLRYSGTNYELALDRPAVALSSALDGSGSGNVTTRTYVYTWVTSLGEESEPSPPSVALDWQPGYDVVLSGFAATPSSRLVTRQRIYRSQTGQSGTYFYLIAERAAGTSDFTDDIAVDAFQEPLPSADWNAPPDELEGLVALPNGMMAAFVGKKLYFCEPYRPHAWPEKYVLTMTSPIVGLGAVGSSLIVMTEGQPHLVTGSAPESMQSVKIERNFPCINARGIVDLGYAIAFPSNDGIVIATADGGMRLATSNIFNPIDWLTLSPSTMIAGQLNGRYVAFYSSTDTDGSALAGALLLDLSGESAFLVRNEAIAAAVSYEIETGALYYRPENSTSIRRLDAPNAGRLNQYWKSKAFVLPYPENFGAILIDSTEQLNAQDADNLEAEIAAITAANAILLAAGPTGGEIAGAALGVYSVAGDSLATIPTDTSGVLTVGIFADGVQVATVTEPNRPIRLPAGFRARKWEIDVFGNIVIEHVTMAKTIDELKS